MGEDFYFLNELEFLYKKTLLKVKGIYFLLYSILGVFFTCFSSLFYIREESVFIFLVVYLFFAFFHILNLDIDYKDIAREIDSHIGDYVLSSALCISPSQYSKYTHLIEKSKGLLQKKGYYAFYLPLKSIKTLIFISILVFGFRCIILEKYDLRIKKFFSLILASNSSITFQENGYIKKRFSSEKIAKTLTQKIKISSQHFSEEVKMALLKVINDIENISSYEKKIRLLKKIEILIELNKEDLPFLKREFITLHKELSKDFRVSKTYKIKKGCNIAQNRCKYESRKNSLSGKSPNSLQTSSLFSKSDTPRNRDIQILRSSSQVYLPYFSSKEFSCVGYPLYYQKVLKAYFSNE